jgi:limonene-1,2-epoxide hydrolase
MTVALNAVITPWVAILAIGALRTKTYDPTDLQAFAQGRHGGRYWSTGGWNVPAVVAWTVGAVFRPVGAEHDAVRWAAGRHCRRGRPEHHRIGRPGRVDLRRFTEFYQGMTRSPDEVVTEFCKLWSSPDPEKLAGYFTEDAIYHNIPMDPVQGREAIKEFIAGFTAAFDGIDFRVHRQLSNGDLVMNERTDVMRRKDGGEIPLPVAGVFEVIDGKITAWRDYFDMATITSAFS